MFDIEFINIDLTYSPIYFWIGLFSITAFALFTYKYTIPRLSSIKKSTLIIVRTLALILILLAIFEPIVKIGKEILIESKNVLFIDNSRSISLKDSINKADLINDIISRSSSNELFEVYTFGKSINPLEENRLFFNESITNFENIFLNIAEVQNIASATIISDGSITEGSEGINNTNKLGIPIYTLGIGQKLSGKDISIKKVNYNDYIYANKPTVISTFVNSKETENSKVLVTLSEGRKLIDRREVILSESGINKVDFTYTPAEPGEKQLNISVSQVEDEVSYENNAKTFFINVLKSKIKVCIVSGSPSSDVSFLKSILKKDENLEISSLVEIASNKFIERNSSLTKIDSADILFLVGFPSAISSNNIINKINNAIKEKPYLITLSDGLDFSKLKILNNNLPFSFSSYNYNYISTRIEAVDKLSSLLKNNSTDHIYEWNNLPPIYKPSFNISSKSGSNILALSVINNQRTNSPLIINRQVADSKSIAMLFKDVWRLKLQASNKEAKVLDNFILQSVKWLNASDDQEKVQIKSSKRIYSRGELVEFSAKIYDDTFNHIDNAQVELFIISDQNEYKLEMFNNNGIYEAQLELPEIGDYRFSGNVKVGNEIIGKKSGRFTVTKTEVEKIFPTLNDDYLRTISDLSGGKYYTMDKYSNLLSDIKALKEKNKKTIISSNEFSLWSNEYLVIIIVLLFSIEWFFRKRWGLL